MIIFKLPYHETVYTTDNDSTDCFVNFFSFDSTQKICFNGKIFPAKNSCFGHFDWNPTAKHSKDSFEEKEEYLERLERTIKLIKNTGIPKLVISRRKKISYSEICVEGTFTNLCRNYPNAFVYAFKNEDEVWCGAFSELLGKFDKKTGIFETMSLAGTLSLKDDWREKELDEQQTVTDYIASILTAYSKEVIQSEITDHISGNIKHLRTDLTAKINAEQLDRLIGELHPTPAVCGVPVDFCKEAIQKIEKYPREYYAGYSRIEMEDTVYFFVNLRCAKIWQDHAALFVGGGITAQSSPEIEWNETELKSQAIARNLAAKAF